ncbi:MAG: ADP-ribosylglycohydrolase family protein [Bacteroidota bacterium]
MIKKSILILLLTSWVSLAHAQHQEKTEGLLMGSFIGDAAGGPDEFIPPPKRNWWSTSDTVLNEALIKEIAAAFKLKAYYEDPDPYGPYPDLAPAGTITDDSRFKMMFIQSIGKKGQLSAKRFAKALLDYPNQVPAKYKNLTDQWLEQFVPSALYVSGKHKDSHAKPPETIWAGVPTNLGQMAFLPIAALYPNNPTATYLNTWEVDYFDFGFAKDMHASINAGLSHAFNDTATWAGIKDVMIKTDPYEMNDIPWAKRRTNYWIKFAEDAAERSNGNIKTLFSILENESQAIQWWDTWIPLVLMISVGEITNYDPLATLQLSIEFGFDTDSYAQLIGAFMGVLYGPDFFPTDIREAVKRELLNQYEVVFDDLITKLKAIEP